MKQEEEKYFSFKDIINTSLKNQEDEKGNKF